MPGLRPSMAVQKKQSVIPPSQGPLSTHTITSQRVGNRSERAGENGSHIKSNLQRKKTACSDNKFAQICNSASPRTAAASNGLNVDERLKAARERREEQQKLLVSRELSRLEREQRAKRYYEQQLQNRKRKLQEQRVKEERRRAAVEEKRKQRLREEKERYESAVRRTLEKSQKVQQHLNQHPRGRVPTKYAPRRFPLTTWEKNLVSRLLTPTCSYLARSKSAGCQSGGEVSYHSMNTTTHKLQHSSNSRNIQQKSIGVAQIKAGRQLNTFQKKSSNSPDKRSSSVNTRVKPTGTQSPAVSSSPERSPRRSVSKHSTPTLLELASVPEEDAAVCGAALSPGNTRPVKRPDKGERGKLQKESTPGTPCSNLSEREASIRTAGDGSPSKPLPHSASQPPEITLRPSAGTSDPGEALRLLAEKRREAQLQRQREENERLQWEEAERRSREELEHRRAEDRTRQEAEAQRLIEEKKRREEEEQRRAEEERAQAMREAALLQKQREEELAKERARAEQLQQEREMVAQKEDEARQARKKRLEEIMRRTRRTDSPDTNTVPPKILPNEGGPKVNTVPVHNGMLEDAVKLPVGSKTTQLGLKNEEDMLPVVAFKERKSHRALSGLEEIQTHQRAEVI